MKEEKYKKATKNNVNPLDFIIELLSASEDYEESPGGDLFDIIYNIEQTNKAFVSLVYNFNRFEVPQEVIDIYPELIKNLSTGLSMKEALNKCLFPIVIKTLSEQGFEKILEHDSLEDFIVLKNKI